MLLFVMVLSTFLFGDQCDVGIKSGVVYSELNIAAGSDYNSNPLIAFDGGLVLFVTIYKQIQFEMNLRYSPRGFVFPFFISDEYGMSMHRSESKTVVQCISFPLLINYSFFDHFFVSGGPRFDYLISEEDYILEWLSSKKINKMEFGYDVGIGFNKHLGKKLQCSVEFRCSPSISNYIDNSKLTAMELLCVIRI